MIGVVIAEADTQGSIVELAIAGDEVRSPGSSLRTTTTWRASPS
jgi:hypothetical protein